MNFTALSPTQNLTELTRRVHAGNAKWWQDLETGLPIKRNKGELLALIHSELSEAYEGEASDDMMDDKLPQFRMAPVEIIDAIIRQLDYLGGIHPDCDPQKIFDDIFKAGCMVRLKGVNKAACLMEIHGLVSRALEGERKGLRDEVFSHLEQAPVDIVKAIFCELEYLDRFHPYYSVAELFEAKMHYNSHREDHKPEHRKAPGGKSF